MARGDMKVDTIAYASEVEILNRAPFEAVPNTIDFSGVSTVDAVSGQKVVKAGTPVSVAGVPVTASPYTGAVGILLHDCYESHPQTAVLKKAYINKARAEANSSLTYNVSTLTTALVAAGCRIAFE